MKAFRKVYQWVSAGGNVIAGVFITIIMLLTVGEIAARYVFNHPIPGSFEIIGISMGVLTTIGFAFALEKDVHIRATILVDRMSGRIKYFFMLAAYFLGAIVTSLMSWQLVLAADKSYTIREMYTGGSNYVPVYPTKILMAFAMILFAVAYLLISIEKVRKREIVKQSEKAVSVK